MVNAEDLKKLSLLGQGASATVELVERKGL